MMRNLQFDAFGEPLATLAQLADAPQRRASRVVTRLGTGVFWALVIAIVAARAAYFDPDYARAFSQVAANVLHAVRLG